MRGAVKEVEKQNHRTCQVWAESTEKIEKKDRERKRSFDLEQRNQEGTAV